MSDYQKLYSEFISTEKSLLIAPAGYGKTHSIASCLKLLKDEHNIENQLILTHTHAGVASIKEKINRVCPECKCHVETISSFAQKYVESFFCGVLPEQDQKEYFPFIIKKATLLFCREPIKTIISKTYSCLFVDEYQDCTESQHQMIIALSEIISTRIMGDHLQGIFSFNGETLVNFSQLSLNFKIFRLNDPWRWLNSNPELGEWTKRLRINIESNTPLELSELNRLPGCHFFLINEDDIDITGSDYRKILNQIVYNNDPFANLGSTLIISETNIWQRVNLKQSLSNRFRLIEAFDDKDFYKYARNLDALLASERLFYDFITLLKGTKHKTRKSKKRSSTLITGLSYYFNDDTTIPNPRKDPLKTIVKLLRELELHPTYKRIAVIINQIIELPNAGINRRELLLELVNALLLASSAETSVYEAMKSQRNIRRQMGRKIQGRCIGTTLLTKGLEFDTVVVLNAHKITNPKNLYVALTRASKRLILFSQRQNLTFLS